MPTGASSYAHTDTPTMAVSDARGLLLRTVQFHRREATDPVDTRVTQQGFDAVGRLTASRDPYLFDLAHTDASTPFNLSQVASLSGGALMTDSLDAGWRVVLPGDAGQPLERWDGRGSHSLTEYDELLRSVAVREHGREVAEHTLERFTYADASAESAARNLCGQPIRHDDPAGTVHVHNLNITGNVLSHTRKFLTGTDAPDWPADVAGRDALLEPGDGATTAYTFAPGGEPLSQTDAFGNVLAYAYTVDGVLKNTKLTLAGAGQLEKLLVSAIHYNASGQIEAETAGNGVITRHRYDEANGRLTELSTLKADGTPLQDLKYHYDAAGNVLSIEDAAQPIRYFANQRIAPLKTYRYDTLDQLIEATGCEAKTGSGGPTLPDFQALPLDPSQLANYTQTFYYDAGGNLLDLVHVGAQAHGRTLTRARYSNRCLPERDNRPPTEDELAKGFDANGNLRELQVGQSLTWDLRNQLRDVRPVVREDKEDDCECYIYDGGGQRVRKVRSSLTNARAVLREVRYLPGVEVRSHSGSGEILHVITVSAGSNSVQVLYWAARQPQEIAQDQVCYGLGDHLKSITLELDQNAELISREWYYAFGGTAYWEGRNAVEIKYKTLRYSRKERDATGLYYYGFRYYAPWLERWINPDPAGDVDGLNLFGSFRNAPTVYFDPDGRMIRRSLSSLDRGQSFAPTFTPLNGAGLSQQKKQEVIESSEVIRSHSLMRTEEPISALKLAASTKEVSLENIKLKGERLGTGAYGEAWKVNQNVYKIYKTTPVEIAAAHGMKNNTAANIKHSVTNWNYFFNKAYSGAYKHYANATEVRTTEGVLIMRTPFIEGANLNEPQYYASKVKNELLAELENMDRALDDNKADNIKIVNGKALIIDFDLFKFKPGRGKQSALSMFGFA